MFPIELIGRVIEYVLTKVGDSVWVRKWEKRGDSKVSFGRDLLALYEDLGSYRDACERLVWHMRQPGFTNPDDRSFRQNIEGANRQAVTLRDVTGRIVAQFWPLVEEKFDVLLDELPGRRHRSTVAEKRALVLDVYDESLVGLARLAFEEDMHVVMLSRQISTMYFDRKSHQAHFWIPPEGDLRPIIPFLGYGYDTEVENRKPWIPWVPADPVLSVSLSGSAEQLLPLIQLVEKNVAVVELLRNQLRLSLQNHFSIEDLLSGDG